MAYYLSKLLPLLLMPVSVSVVTGLLALLFLYTKRRRLALAFLSASVLVLWLSSTPFVASALLMDIEKRHPPLAMEDVPVSDCIVTLGGALGPALKPRTQTEMSDAVDRVYQAARLFRHRKGRFVVVAAGNQPWTKQAPTEASQVEGLLLEWGVPQSAILLDGASRNTRENALNAQRLISQAGCESTLLVTSAWHMPRAMATFQKVGVDAVPVSVDVRFVHGLGDTLSGFIPQADALSTTSMVIREWMGTWVYRWRGWI